MRSIPLAAEQPEHERICCDGCGMLLAKQHESGGFAVVVTGLHIDPDGRIVIKCPNCNKRVKLRPHRLRAA